MIRFRKESLKRYVTNLCNFRLQSVTYKTVVPFIFILTLVCCPVPEASVLAYTTPTSTTVTLNWTASGDDRSSGRASFYDLRYSPNPLTEQNWDSAHIVPNPPTPQYSGTAETHKVLELTPNTIYYFAIKVADEEKNWSLISNVVQTRTAQPPQCGDLNESGELDITDLIFLIRYMFIDGIPQFNLDAIDLNSSGNIDISDLMRLIGYMFDNGPPISCPY